MNIIKSTYFHSLFISIIELFSLYILLRIVEGEISFTYLTIFLILQILKVIIYNCFRSYALLSIDEENRIEFKSIKSAKLNNIYEYRIEDDKVSTEILTSSQEISNATYAKFQKNNAIITIGLFLLYGFYVERYIIAIVFLGGILYLTNKYAISRSREKIIARISQAIDGLGEQLGIFVSNLKFFLFASHGNQVEERIHEGFNQIREEQSKVNLINFASRPLLESIAVVFIIILFNFGIEQKSLIGLVVIILKSVPLLAQINYANSTIELADKLKSKNVKASTKHGIEDSDWEQFNFTYQGRNLSLVRGEKILLSGGSGSGKSTLLEMLAGITKPNFELYTKEKIYSKWLFSKNALVYINQQVKPWSERVSNFIDLSKGNNTLKIFFSEQELARIRVQDVRLNELSGGQFQRVLLAKYINSPGLLLLDESISGLDKGRADLIIEELLKSRATIVLITHSQVDCLKFDRVWKI